MTTIDPPSDDGADDLDRPERVLISASRYGDWLKLMRAVLGVVLPTTAFGVLVTAGNADQSAWDTTGDVVLAVVGTMVHLVFWLTLVYAYIDWRERVGEVRASALPRLSVIDETTVVRRGVPARRRVRLGEVVVPIAAWVLFVSFAFNQRRIGIVDADGQVIPVLRSDQWNGWIPFIVWMACNAVACLVATYRMGRWTPLTSVGAIISAITSGALTLWLLATGRGISREWIEEVDSISMSVDALYDIAVWSSAVLMIAAIIWTTWVAGAGWVRDRTAPPLQYD